MSGLFFVLLLVAWIVYTFLEIWLIVNVARDVREAFFSSIGTLLIGTLAYATFLLLCIAGIYIIGAM